jgi:hypothetical protein
MNSYPWISIGQIIGRAIRRSGLKDTSLIPDMHEWAAEAMEIIQITDMLQFDFEKVEVYFHKAKKPCGMRELLGVEYCGTRLHLGNSVKDPRTGTPLKSYSPYIEDAVFVSGITVQDTPSGNKTFIGAMQHLDNLPWHTCEWYKDDGSCLITSFSDGEITIYHNRTPLDKNGYLQIPNEGNLKEALTWFLRSCLAGAGHNNGDLSESQMYDKFLQFTGYAKEAISFPTVDKVETTTETLIQLMPDPNYYESFFR